MRKIFITVTILLIAATTSAQVLLQRAVVSQAGGMASNGTTTLQYTVSQPAVGVVHNIQTIGQFGFWNVANGVASVRSTSASGPIQSLLLYPNPSQGEVKVDVALSTSGSLDLVLYDDGGRMVKSIYSGKSASGVVTYRFDASSLASGSYFIAAKSPGALLQTKLTVVK